MKSRDNKNTRERIRSKACKTEMVQITDFGLGRKSVTSHLWQRRMAEMMRSRSESVIAAPEGRQRPRLNKSSATSRPVALRLCERKIFPLFSLFPLPASITFKTYPRALNQRPEVREQSLSKNIRQEEKAEDWQGTKSEAKNRRNLPKTALQRRVNPPH